LNLNVLCKVSGCADGSCQHLEKIWVVQNKQLDAPAAGKTHKLKIGSDAQETRASLMKTAPDKTQQVKEVLRVEKLVVDA
jgi:hypothetical protein